MIVLLISMIHQTDHVQSELFVSTDVEMLRNTGESDLKKIGLPAAASCSIETVMVVIGRD